MNRFARADTRRELLDERAAARRAQREQLRARGLCVNDSLNAPKHAKATRGGRCWACWIKKLDSQRRTIAPAQRTP